MRLALHFDAGWEDALWRAAAVSLPAEALGESALLAGVRSLSIRYTTARERIGAEPDQPRERAARLLFFAVADALKVHLPLAELLAAGAARGRDGAFRVLDVGAGVGATSLGAATYLAAAGARRLEIEAVDRDPAALAVCRAALAQLEPLLSTLSIDLRTRAGDAVLPAAAPGYDLVLAGAVLNELPPAVRFDALRSWLSLAAPGGGLLVLEPALRVTARELERLRDLLLRDGGAEVVGPCPHQAACPMSSREHDWCHEDRPWQAPPRFARLRARVGLRREGLKFAYLALRRTGGPGVPACPQALGGADRLRVVADPRVSKGKRELQLCGEGGLRTVRLLRRDVTERSAAFQSAARGDVLRVPAGTNERLAPEGEVTRE